ncbi:uncharacterized protein LOC111268029 [Varroa jacobsoni]|uniref:uncharacterized protein LOC111268029 n=1 Tax=Varroa jacobsoni TaxID=62625 RepID=UPI000BF3D5A9|nr:uncharacterized protein LOC111268029 [Varroa jacobsoni]
MSRFNLLIRVDVRFALIIVLLASGTQGDEAEDEKTDGLSARNNASVTVRSTYVCPNDSEAIMAKPCLVGCKRGEHIDNFPYDQRSRFDGCNTCSTHVYRYPDGSTCEGLEMCTSKACLPITSILPGPQKAHIQEDE